MFYTVAPGQSGNNASWRSVKSWFVYHGRTTSNKRIMLFHIVRLWMLKFCLGIIPSFNGAVKHSEYWDTLYPTRWILAFKINWPQSSCVRVQQAAWINFVRRLCIQALEATHRDQRGRTLCPMMNPLLPFTSAHFHFHLHDWLCLRSESSIPAALLHLVTCSASHCSPSACLAVAPHKEPSCQPWPG